MNLPTRSAVIRCSSRLAASALAGLTILAQAETQRVSPERATAVLASSRDVNRIHCAAGVEDVVWSAEKPAKVSQSGDNVFVKFLVARQGEIETRVSAPLDVHVVCGGDVYTLILHPQDIDSATIELGDGTRRALQQAVQTWGALPLEEQVQRFTLAVYRNELPEGFVRETIAPSDPRRSLPLFENAELIGQAVIVAPGTGLRATEYVLHAREPLTLDERDFLVPALGELVGITIEPLTVPRDGFARLIVIERPRAAANSDAGLAGSGVAPSGATR